MLSCKENSVKISESLDQTLPPAERFMMKAHLLICKSCQHFSKQMQLLHSAIQHSDEITEHPDKQNPLKLSKETRQRILNNITKK
jgi:hypothetical protein